MDIVHVFKFTAAFEDGTVIEQNDEDISVVDKTRSCYFDVKEKEKESKLVSFVIHNDSYSLGVDLRDGHFELNGIPFFQHDPIITPYENFEIEYYRTVVREIRQDGTQISGIIDSYTVGWKVTYKGEEIKRIVRF
jgi:hypothetical protein